MVHDAADVEVLSGLSRFRDGFYECLTARADALFELAEATSVEVVYEKPPRDLFPI